MSHISRKETLELAPLLVGPLIEELEETDQDASRLKRNNFLVEKKRREKVNANTDEANRPKSKLKEQRRQQMSQDLDCPQNKLVEMDGGALPFPRVYSFKLLGVILDGGWNFRQHFQELRN